jgi:hypothetical protein
MEIPVILTTPFRFSLSSHFDFLQYSNLIDLQAGTEQFVQIKLHGGPKPE